MNWPEKPHPLEILADWGAPLLLALAAGWSASIAGLPPATVGAAATTALAAGLVAMRLAGRYQPKRTAGFQPVAIEAEEDDVLLLDDPLAEIGEDSRVVRLFEQVERTPGELVLRISDYLSEQGTAPATVASPLEQQPEDASAALHAALANIRANLR